MEWNAKKQCNAKESLVLFFKGANVIDCEVFQPNLTSLRQLNLAPNVIPTS